MSEQIVIRKGGINFFGLLAIVFITLKLTGVIAWSWWWVLAPLWGGIALFAAVFAAILIGGLTVIGIASIAEAIDSRKGRKR